MKQREIEVAEVRSATSVKAFIPFTPLPEDFATHRVAIVKLSRRQEKELRAAQSLGLKVVVEFMITP